MKFFTGIMVLTRVTGLTTDRSTNTSCVADNVWDHHGATPYGG